MTNTRTYEPRFDARTLDGFLTALALSGLALIATAINTYGRTAGLMLIAAAVVAIVARGLFRAHNPTSAKPQAVVAWTIWSVCTVAAATSILWLSTHNAPPTSCRQIKVFNLAASEVCDSWPHTVYVLLQVFAPIVLAALFAAAYLSVPLKPAPLSSTDGDR